jgi:DNA polymerase-1
MPPASSTPRARPSATPGTPSTRRSARPCPMPLRQQIEPIHEVVRLLGWPVLEVPGIEADDAIGTLAAWPSRQGHQVLISTGDKDLAQLVTPQVTLINTMSQRAAGRGRRAGQVRRAARAHRRLPDADRRHGGQRARRRQGRPQDGVKWLPSTARWTAWWPPPAIKGVAGENLRKALDWLPTGRKLVTVVTDCDLAGHVPGWPALEALALRRWTRRPAVAFYERYGFKHLAQGTRGGPRGAGRPSPRRPRAGPPPARRPADRRQERRCPRVRDGAPGSLSHWLERLRGRQLVALDTETDSLDPMRARIVGISFAVEPGRAAYVPLAHDYPDAPRSCRSTRCWPPQALAGGRRAAKLGQNIKYDRMCWPTTASRCAATGTTPCCRATCSRRTSPRPGSAGRTPPGPQGPELRGPVRQGRTRSRSRRWTCSGHRVLGEDSEMTLQVHQVLWPQLQADERLRRVYEDIEMPVSALLQRIERHGVLIDAACWPPEPRAGRAHGCAGAAGLRDRRPALQPGSPKQIGEILCSASSACR